MDFPMDFLVVLNLFICLNLLLIFNLTTLFFLETSFGSILVSNDGVLYAKEIHRLVRLDLKIYTLAKKTCDCHSTADKNYRLSPKLSL
jgi:hypothetical protein